MNKIVVPTWDDYFMTMVYLVAAKSKDKRTHVGAVVVGPKNEVRSMGYNSFPRGLNDNVPERQEKPEKYFFFAHAEDNAINNAAFIGVSLRDCRMYTNGVPCSNCARGIINTGITKVIVDYSWDKENLKKWVEECKRSLQMFKECGVGIKYWRGSYTEPVKYQHKKVIPLFK